MVRPVCIPRLPRLARAAAKTARTTTAARTVTAAAVVAVIAALTACSGPAPSNAALARIPPAKVPPATYYLALGDSLAQGVQPNVPGVSVMTRDGYPDQVFAALHASRPGLKLVKLGCPGETTASMINGGICRYRGGSQLAAAVAFLQAHRGRVPLVTLDIGANDPEHCGGQPGLGQLAKCAVTDIPGAVDNLGTIMARLKAAAGSGVRVANVFGAFETSDFTRPAGTSVPRNVARLCQWTWECAAPPRGPNQHANQAGYQVIARAFLQASGLS